AESDGTEFRAGVDEHLGGIAFIPRRAATPRTAVDEQEDRRVRLSRAIDVELFGFARAIGQMQRLAEARAYRLADAGDALLNLIARRRVKALIVGGIERDHAGHCSTVAITGSQSS